MENKANNFFSRNPNSTSDSDFNEIYNGLKQLTKKEIRAKIDDYFKSYGVKFLEAMIVNSILDIDAAPNNPKPNMNIAFIEKYCVRLSEQVEFKKNLPKILNSWQGWMIAIGTFGYFLVELIKFIIECYCKTR